jgi:hypothetical protein
VETIAVNAVPRIGVIWNPTSHVGVKALYSGAFRAPSINETGLNHPVLTGTPGLNPEKVRTMDLSVSYQANRFQGALTFFRSWQTDSIVIVSLPVKAQYLNLGEATFQGFELEGKYYLRKNYFVTGSVSYQANLDGDGNRSITPIPKLGAKGGLSYRAENGLTLGIFDNYQGSFHGLSDTTVNPRAAAYHLVSSHIRYDLSRYMGSKRDGIALFAHAENLPTTGYGCPLGGIQTTPFPLTADGRYISVSNSRWAKNRTLSAHESNTLAWEGITGRAMPGRNRSRPSGVADGAIERARSRFAGSGITSEYSGHHSLQVL